ncbi:hypothetical protein J3R75_003788 [Oligosphaera ethanolica]|uniref:Uncharacterized protein n=1 Tax=Oligosphaera ethanolica TaxID=760260 RepID=A0AAE3VJX4_9BACT|nr:hypothetical protein [Oligosphaera ethanolica]
MVTCRCRLAAVEWASRPLRQDGSLNRPRHPRRSYPACLPRRTSRAHSGWKPLLLWARYDSAAAKVGGNQGRMVGRRRAVSFRQIVPGVFHTGAVTDQSQIYFLRIIPISCFPPCASLYYPTTQSRESLHPHSSGTEHKLARVLTRPQGLLSPKSPRTLAMRSKAASVLVLFVIVISRADIIPRAKLQFLW